MFRSSIKICLICIVLTLMPGCWSAVDIQNQHYVTSLGVDYDGEMFFVYAQIVRFENIARMESQGAGSPINTYVGKGEGTSLNIAVSNLYATSQVRIDWGHMKAIVVTERAISSLEKLAGHIYRSPESRYNTWFYVTNGSIEEIFLTNSFYERTSLFSILHMPMNSFRQGSTVPPIQMFKCISISNEPDRITVIPVIGTDNEQWKTNEGELKIFKIIGAYFESYNGVKKILPLDQLEGMRWIDPRLTRTMLTVMDEEKEYAVLILHNTKVKKKTKLVNGEPKFTIKASFKGSLNEYLSELDYPKMIQLAREQIEKEIMEAYELGLKEQLDLFNLMHSFRMKDPDAWKRMTNNGEKFILDEKSLEHLEIDIEIPYNGKYKRRR